MQLVDVWDGKGIQRSSPISVLLEAATLSMSAKFYGWGPGQVLLLKDIFMQAAGVPPAQRAYTSSAKVGSLAVLWALHWTFRKHGGVVEGPAPGCLIPEDMCACPGEECSASMPPEDMLHDNKKSSQLVCGWSRNACVVWGGVCKPHASQHVAFVAAYCGRSALE